MKGWIALLCCFCVSLSYADNPVYDQAMTDAKNSYSHIQSDVAKSGLTPNDIPHFTNSPQAEKYANNPDAMAGDAAIASQTNAESKVINNDFTGGKEVTINPNDPAMQQGAELEADAGNIVHGKDGKYIHCSMMPHCTTSYTEQTCDAYQSKNLTCSKLLDVKVIPNQIADCYHTVVQAGEPSPSATALAHISINNHLMTLWKLLGPSDDGQCTIAWAPLSYQEVHHQTNFTINYARKVTLLLQAGGSYFGNNMRFTASISTLGGESAISNQSTRRNFTVTKTGDYTLSLTTDSPFRWSLGQAFAEVTTAYQAPVEQDNWIDNCASMAPAVASGFCKIASPLTCTSGTQTRNIDGVAVTRPCWAKQQTLQCGSGTPNTQCQAVANKGCSLVSRQCIKKVGDDCVQSKDTYSCETQHCQGSSNICGGNIFCVDGSCYQQTPSQSSANDFAKAGSEMAAAADAAGDAGKGGTQNPSIYTGQAMSCSKDAVGFSNCCRNSGWGKDIHLAHCSQEEKELGAAKQKNEVIYVGGYCSHHTIFGFCTSHSEGYCTFSGMLAKIVQYQGRGQQLGIGFGSGQSPNCRGLTVDELGRIDFSKIDFSSYYNSVKSGTNIPDPDAIKKRIINNLPQGVK